MIPELSALGRRVQRRTKTSRACSQEGKRDRGRNSGEREEGRGGLERGSLVWKGAALQLPQCV